MASEQKLAIFRKRKKEQELFNEKNLLYDKLYEELNSKYLVIISQLKDRHKEKENTLQK